MKNNATTKAAAEAIARACKQPATREEFEHATWRYANARRGEIDLPILFDAGDLGICLLEWTGAFGGHWKNTWFDRLHDLK